MKNLNQLERLKMTKEEFKALNLQHLDPILVDVKSGIDKCTMISFYVDAEIYAKSTKVAVRQDKDGNKNDEDIDRNRCIDLLCEGLVHSPFLKNKNGERCFGTPLEHIKSIRKIDL